MKGTPTWLIVFVVAIAGPKGILADCFEVLT
jgi:hypothetical protein